MRGQGETAEASGKSLPAEGFAAIGLAAVLRALAGETESEGTADGQDAEGIVTQEGDSDDGALAAMQATLAAQGEGDEEGPDAAGDADAGGDEAEVITLAETVDAAGDGIEADIQEAGEALPDPVPGAVPDDALDAAQPDAQADADTQDADETSAAAAVTGRGDAADALPASRGERGPLAANAVAGDGPRASQGNTAAAPSATAAQMAASGDAAASGSDADAQGEGEGEDAQAEQKGRNGRGAGDENRSGVAQEALRRVFGGEAGAGRAALAPGDEQSARHTAEQVARMMQAGAEAVSTPAKGPAQAAAEASTTANGQTNTASQAGAATPQVNGSVLINTPLSAVPMALGMKAMGGASRFDIRLDPAELGRIAVSLDIDDEGTVKARLVVDRVETLQLLQRDARTLERAFEQAGLKPSEDGIDLSLRDDGDRHAGDGDEDEGRGPGDGRDRDGDESEKGLAAAEIRALARETLLARQALRRALGGVDLSI
jgi:flagellar hook-length control protein FliK